jgi:ribose 5-phosphate isomerase B
MTKIYVASDHRGLRIKNELLELYSENDGFDCQDLGAYIFDPNDDFVDYVIKLAEFIKKDSKCFAVLFCGNGVGMCIAANRYPFLRAVNSDNDSIIKQAREHNDCNVLCLGADSLSIEEVVRLINTFIFTKPISEKKYLRRIDKLGSIKNEI